VGAEIDLPDAGLGDGQRRRFHISTGEGQHGPVVMTVGVQVEERSAGGGPQTVQHDLVRSLADVDHALEHHS